MLLVKHSSTLQDIAFDFAMHLDITHKIWSEFIKYNKDKSHLSNADSLFKAIYNDKYNQHQLNNNNYPSEQFNENVLTDGMKMFTSHYSMALKYLESLEANAHNADLSAIESLKSILNVMKSSI